KDTDNHKFKCTFQVLKTKNGKVVFITVFVSPQQKASIHAITIVVQKEVVRIVHEEDEHTHHIKRIVVIREEHDFDSPPVIFVICQNVVICQNNFGQAIAPPITVTSPTQISGIITQTNTQNGQNIAAATNIAATDTTIVTPPPVTITQPTPTSPLS